MARAERPPRRSARRPVLLGLLLVALIALLIARPDLRRPAAHGVHTAGTVLVYDVIGISARTVYGWRLDIAGLGDSPLVRRWQSAVDRAVPEALPAQARNDLDFAADTIRARVFTIGLARGGALEWRLAPAHGNRVRLYGALEYRRTPADRWQSVRPLQADGRAHRFVATDTGDYRLVFQPALFADVAANLATARGGSLPMPVAGAHTRDIGGGFGVARDGGRRRHEGIDIFAKRNTPVRAVADGRVSTGNGGLGGHYIFLSSGLFGPRYYYAHLDHFAVADGTRVTQGQVIGYVGNSGNAAGGPTHLHFGIYTAIGPIDPAPFVAPMPALPAKEG